MKKMKKYYVTLNIAELKYDESFLSSDEVRKLVYANLDKETNLDCLYKTFVYTAEEEETAKADFAATRVFITDYPSKRLMHVLWCELSYTEFNEDREPDIHEIIDERFPAHEAKEEEIDLQAAALKAVRKLIDKTKHEYPYSVSGEGYSGGGIKSEHVLAADRIASRMKEETYETQEDAEIAAKAFAEEELRKAEKVGWHASIRNELRNEKYKEMEIAYRNEKYRGLENAIYRESENKKENKFRNEAEEEKSKRDYELYKELYKEE